MNPLELRLVDPFGSLVEAYRLQPADRAQLRSVAEAFVRTFGKLSLGEAGRLCDPLLRVASVDGYDRTSPLGYRLLVREVADTGSSPRPASARSSAPRRRLPAARRIAPLGIYR